MKGGAPNGILASPDCEPPQSDGTNGMREPEDGDEGDLVEAGAGEVERPELKKGGKGLECSSDCGDQKNERCCREEFDLCEEARRYWYLVARWPSTVCALTSKFTCKRSN